MRLLYSLFLILLFSIISGCQNHYEKGLTLLKDKDFKTAELELSKLTPEDENYKKSGDYIIYIWGCTAFNEKRYPEATKYLKKFLKTKENNYEKPNEIEITILGDALLKLDKLKEIHAKEMEKLTGEYLREALKSNKKDASIDEVLNDIKVIK